MTPDTRLLHEAELLVSAPFGVRSSQAFGRVAVTDTSLGDHSLGDRGLGQTGDSCQAETEI